MLAVFKHRFKRIGEKKKTKNRVIAASIFNNLTCNATATFNYTPTTVWLMKYNYVSIPARICKMTSASLKVLKEAFAQV